MTARASIARGVLSLKVRGEGASPLGKGQTLALPQPAPGMALGQERGTGDFSVPIDIIPGPEPGLSTATKKCLVTVM